MRLLSRPCSCLIPSSCRVFVVVAASKGGAGAPGRVLDDQIEDCWSPVLARCSTGTEETYVTYT